MEKKYTVLRIIGTVWKIVAWIALVVGVLAAVGALVGGIVGARALRQVAPVPGGAAWGYSVAAGIIGFIVMLIGALFYFLLWYGAGELIYLFVAIEDNTRHAAQQVEWLAQREPVVASGAPPVPYAPASYSVPPATPVASSAVEAPKEPD